MIRSRAARRCRGCQHRKRSRFSNAASSDTQRHARDINVVLAGGVAVLSLFPGRAVSEVWTAALARPAFFAGRIGTGIVSGAIISRISGNPFIGVALGVFAAQGSAVEAAQRGALGMEVVKGFFLGK